MNNPMVGIHYFLEGFHLISRPGLRRYVIIPGLINILLFIGLFFLFQHYFNQFNAWFENYLPTWLNWLSTVLWLLFLVSFMLFFIYTFVVFANLVGGPFNSLLAEKIEFYLTGKKVAERTWLENMRDIPRILGRQFAILAYYLPRMLLILILFFIPLVHLVAPILWFIFNAWFLSMTYLDYPTDNHRIPLRELREWLKTRRGTALGFGFAALVATMIPFVNFISIPVGVAGATRFWIEERKK